MTQDRLTAALNYAAMGWPVFPVRHDKTPYTINGVLDGTTDPEQIEKWWERWPGANIAFSPGEVGMAVLDYDPGSPPPERVHEVADLRETGLIARTPRGGTHEYYALDGSDPPVASRPFPLAQHVDIRSYHGYVLLPPSATKDGEYTWVSRKKPALRSESFLQAAGKFSGKNADRDNWIIEPDLPENVTRACQWLRGEIKIGNSWCQPAIQGSNGDNATYAAAAMMKSCGLSEGKALEILWEEYNVDPRPKGGYCDPPWEWDDLASKVRNSYEYNTSPPGNVTPAYHVAKTQNLFEPARVEIVGEGRVIKSGKYRVIDYAGLSSIVPPEWLIPEVLPEEAYAMLVGPSKTYKTFLALDLALTLATAAPALVAGEWKGLFPAPRFPGPVLFIAGEGWGNIRKRVECWVKYHGVPAPDFTLADPVPHVSDEGIDGLVEAAMKQHPEGYRLVIIDTVGRAMQGVNENSQEAATAFTRLVDMVRRELCSTVLALHHTGWEHKERARGSSAFLADTDTMLLTSAPEKFMAKITMAKQKDYEEWSGARYAKLERVTLEDGRESLVPVVTDPPKTEKGSTHTALAVLDDYIYDFLKTHPLQNFSDYALSEALVYHKLGGEDGAHMGLSARTLRNKDPKSIQAVRAPGSGARTQGMYHPETRYWRYSPVPASDFSPVG